MNSHDNDVSKVHDDFPQVDAYKASLSQLRFSDEAKAQMVHKLVGAYEASQESDATMDAAAAPKQSRTSATELVSGRRITGKSRRPHSTARTARRRQRNRIAALAACLALALCAGGVAYASGYFVSVGTFVSHLFGGESPYVEIVDKIGRPVGVSASSNGVTVSADAIVGDKTNMAVIFSVYKDDGTPFEGIEALDNGLYPMSFSEDLEVSLPIWHSYGATGSSYFYDADPTDNAIQLVETRSYEGLDNTALQGCNMTVHLRDLTYFGLDAESDRRVIAQGSWDLTFPLDYEDATIELPADFSFDLNGTVATASSLALSPIALHIAYTAPLPQGFIDAPSGQEPAENSALSDALLVVPITLNLRDGTAITVEDSGSGSLDLDEDAGIARCEKGIFLDRIVDLNEVQGITIGDTTIDL